MNRIFKALFLSVLGMAAAGPAMSAQTLDTVVVTAGRIEEKAANVTQTMTVIPREEIEKNQYRDMGAMLRNYGLQVDGYTPNGALSATAIRGMRSTVTGDNSGGAILMLVNGRRMGMDNISMIPMVNVERVEIIRGPGAVQYGTSASGGVVNVITRRGSGFAGKAEIGAGSWDGYRAQAELSGSGYGFDASAGWSFRTQDDYRTGAGRTYTNTAVESHTAWNLNLGYTFLEEHRIGVNTMGAYAGDMGSPGYFVSIMPEEWTRRSNASVDFTYDGGYSPWGLSWNARYFNGANDYLNDSPLPGAWGDPVYFEQTTRYQGAQGQISFTRDFLTLTGGVDWLTSDMDQKSATLSYPNGSKSTIGGTGFFLLAKMAFFEDRLILNGGIRYDRYSLEIESRKDDLSHFTPSVGAAWRPLDWLTLRANYGESYRLPTSQELLGYNSLYLGWPLNYFGNPDLDPEKGKSWDAGFEVNYRSLNIGLTYFQTDYNNKIVTRPVGFDQQYYNLPGTTKYRGLEFQAGYDLGDAFGWPFMLRPYVSLTHLFKYDDPDGVKLNNIAEQDISAGIGFHHPDIGLTADLRVVYFGRQWQTDWTTGSPTYGQKVRTGGDATVDFFVSKTLRSWEKYGTLSLTGEIRNLFDVDYALYKDYPMPGRSFYLGLRYEF